MAALLLLPEELWEMILMKLDYDRDVSNMLRAYPELAVGAALTRMRNLSLFDKIFGNVLPWLTQEEILLSRQVCWHWRETVDNHLTNHQDKRAFQHESGSGSEVIRQKWIPPARQSHYYLDKYFHGTKAFSSSEMCINFLEDMEMHTLEWSPFVGRSLYVKNAGGKEFAGTILLDVFRQFGKHLWFLTLESGISTESVSVNFAHIVIESLSLVPNLKSMEIVTFLDACKIELLLRNKGQSLPSLPQLETLTLNHFYLRESIVSLFIEGYSKQLRRLDLVATLWRSNYSDKFPNLTELRLLAPIRGDDLLHLLRSIESPQIHSLDVDFSVGDCPEEFNLFLDDIFPLLARFPRINSSTFMSSSTLRLGRVIPPESFDFSVPSLKSLVIWSNNGHWHEMKHWTFECFPGLEYLKIAGKIKMEQLWRSLPRLKEVTVGGYYGKCVTRRRD